MATIDAWLARTHDPAHAPASGPGVHRDAEPPHGHVGQAAIDAVMRDHHEVHRLLDATLTEPVASTHVDDRLDRVLLHPVWGMAILTRRAVPDVPGRVQLGQVADGPHPGADGAAPASWWPRHMADGMLRSLLVDGVIAGAGSVLVFLPQILILFLFILALEDSGYLPRAAFLLDRVMAGVGLTGRSFIPLLSSFACAIPGIMATRTIADPRDRLSTILIAPLMTCSARLPVYALLIGAFIPARTLALGVNLQGLVLFVLYMAGIVSAMGVAWVLQRLGRRAGPGAPHADDGAAGLPLAQRAQPGDRPVGARAHLHHARGHHHPVADDRAVVPVHVPRPAGGRHRARPSNTAWPAAWATCCNTSSRRSASTGRSPSRWCRAWPRARWRSARWAPSTRCRPRGDAVAEQLSPLIQHTWSLPTACALLAWYVFAPQCVATLSVTRRETGGWRQPIIMASYLFALAYVAAGLTFYGVRYFFGA